MSMDYDSLKEDVFNILKTPEYNITIKMYDKQGQLTTNLYDVVWFYLTPYDCMIRIPEGEKFIVKFWKNKNVIHKNIILKIMNRVKNVSNFRGFTFNVKIFNKESNKEKINYNSDVMEESFRPLNEYIDWVRNFK